MAVDGALQPDPACQEGVSTRGVTAALRQADGPRVLRALAWVLYDVSIASFLLALVVVQAIGLWVSSSGWDFRAFYEGGKHYLHLTSPYVSGSLAELTSRQNFVYPLPTAALFAPVSLLPYNVAQVLFVVLNGVLLVAAIRLLGVRDLRCYLAVLVGGPALNGLDLGTVSPILVFLVAITWRHRNRAWIVALALALLVLTKLFLWPVGVWLLATRRFKSVLLAAAACVLAVALATAPLGLQPLLHYPALLKAVSAFEAATSASLVGLGATLTGSTSFGNALSLIAGGLLLLVVVVAAQKGKSGEEYAFRVSVLASLALSPIVWNHYLALLFVPLALIQPRFSPLWLGTAWVLGAVGNSMEDVSLAVVLVAIWSIAMMQTGVLTPLLRRWPWPLARTGTARPFLKLASSLSLWAAFAWVLVALLGVVPAVAALRSPTGADASGTAAIRLLGSGDRICIRMLVRGVPLPAVAQLVDDHSHAVLIQHRMNGHRLNYCGRPPRGREPANLAKAFVKRRAPMSLRVTSASDAERLLLSGVVLRPQDMAKLQPS